METQCRDDSWTMTNYGSKCCEDKTSVCYEFSSQLCSDSTSFMPDALADVNCYLSASAASADATFLETFAAACPFQCWSSCPDESCDSYSDDYYHCSCGEHVISTEEECTCNSSLWHFLRIYFARFGAFKASGLCSCPPRSARCSLQPT